MLSSIRVLTLIYRIIPAYHSQYKLCANQAFWAWSRTVRYTLKKLIQLYSNIMGYSVVPLRLSTYCGYFFSILSILGALAIVIRKLVNPAMALGWPSMMCAICFSPTHHVIYDHRRIPGQNVPWMNKQPQFVVREVISQNSTATAIQDTANTPDKVTTVKSVLPTETISAKNSCEPSDNE